MGKEDDVASLTGDERRDGVRCSEIGEASTRFEEGQGGEIRSYPFRVFTTTPDERRRNRLVQVAGRVKSNMMCWFAVLNHFLNDPFGSVWVRAKEYKELISDLPQSIQDELERKHGRPSKKAQKALEEIENHIIKHSLLDEG